MLLIKYYCGSLFDATNIQCVAHCVSACATQSKGFALELCNRFPGNRIISDFKLVKGQCVLVSTGNLLIINLITKQNYFEKPTKKDFLRCLYSMRNLLCRQTAIKNVSMPMIGTGLDNLSAAFVTSALAMVFSNFNIEIHIYLL